MHPLTYPPADRHYLKTVVRFVGVSQLQNHSYLQMNYTHRGNVQTTVEVGMIYHIATTGMS
jgi:hypothetical protein